MCEDYFHLRDPVSNPDVNLKLQIMVALKGAYLSLLIAKATKSKIAISLKIEYHKKNVYLYFRLGERSSLK